MSSRPAPPSPSGELRERIAEVVYESDHYVGAWATSLGDDVRNQARRRADAVLAVLPTLAEDELQISPSTSKDLELERGGQPPAEPSEPSKEAIKVALEQYDLGPDGYQPFYSDVPATQVAFQMLRAAYAVDRPSSNELTAEEAEVLYEAAWRDGNALWHPEFDQAAYRRGLTKLRSLAASGEGKTDG